MFLAPVEKNANLGGEAGKEGKTSDRNDHGESRRASIERTETGLMFSAIVREYPVMKDGLVPIR